MISFGHTAVGVIVGVTFYQFLAQGDLATGLITAGSVGFVSHYVMDFIPHGHFFRPKDFNKSILPVIFFDLLGSIALFLGIIYLKEGFSQKFLYIMFGIGGSQLPDVIDGLMRIKMIKTQGVLKIEYDFHEVLHWHGRGSNTLLLDFRDIWQVFIVLIALFLVIF